VNKGILLYLCRMKRIILYSVAGIVVLLSGCNRHIVLRNNGNEKTQTIDSISYSYIYGEALHQKMMGNIGEALKYFEQCIHLNPRNDAPYYQIAQISVQRGDTENGKDYAVRACRIDEKNIWYLTLAGDIYYQLKMIDSSIYYYEKAVKAFPEKDELRLTLGGLYSEKKEFKKAGEVYAVLEQKYGSGSNVTVMAVKNLISSGKFDEAESKVAIVLKKDPDNILFNGILAEIYKSKGNKAKAEETYRKMMNIDSTNVQTVLSITDFYLGNGDYEEFYGFISDLVIDNQLGRDDYLNIFKKILDYSDFIKERGVELEVTVKVLEENFKDEQIIQMIRPELYEKEGKAGNAAARLEELIKKYPDNYMYWEKLLLLYSDLRDYNRLYLLGKECSGRFNLSYPAKVLYASAAMEKKEYATALEELEKARILAGNQDVLVAQVLSMEADVYYRKKDYLKSFELYRSILKKNPEDMIVLNNYAYFLAEQNQDLKEAERMIRIVMNKEGGNGTYVDTYAWVLYKRGKYKEAEKVLVDLMNTNKSEDSEWFEHYGYIMKALKKCEVAVKYWQKALDLNNEKEYLKKEIENCTR